LIGPNTRRLKLTRVPIAGIDLKPDPLVALGERLSEALAASDVPIIALIDSPRWPSDCDCRESSLHLLRRGHAGGRHIDMRLRTIVRSLAAASVGDSALRISLFPTPRHDYFLRCISDLACKPHLRALGRQLFNSDLPLQSNNGPRGGAIFTRFMLIGFAAYRALDEIGITAFEAYPDLQFRLWRDDHPLAPKSAGRIALANRSQILATVAAAFKRATPKQIPEQIARLITTMDQADAAILAVSARAALDHGAIACIDEPEEGCFALPLQSRQAASLGLMEAIGHADSLTLERPLVSFMGASHRNS
jgi:hypothetical protein